MELRYLRDTDGRKVDFVVIRDRKPLFGVEAKTGEPSISLALRYLQRRVAIPRWYSVHLGDGDGVNDGVRALLFANLRRGLEIP